MNRRPKIAFWFRYGAAAHSELFHALPGVIEELSKHCETHYYGMRTRNPVPEVIRKNAVLHELPFFVNRASTTDKMLKTTLWIFLLPFIALHSRLRGMSLVYIDETIPLTTLIARLFYGGKVAVTVADFFVDIYLTGFTAFAGRAIKALDIRTWKKLPVVFTRAKSAKTWLIERGVPAPRIHAVYDPCDLSLYHPMPYEQRANARTELGFSSDNVVLVHHGILHPNKGNDLIIRAVAEISDQFPQLRYLLIGDGPEMKNIRALIRDLKKEDICLLTGWLPSPTEVNRALNAGDIGLIMRTAAASSNFHLTGALVHSMACGLPLLAARLDGISEVVKEGRNGLLFDPSNMDEFKAKLIRLAQDSDLRTALGQSALEDARLLFDMQKTIAATVEPLLQVVLGENKYQSS